MGSAVDFEDYWEAFIEKESGKRTLKRAIKAVEENLEICKGVGDCRFFKLEKAIFVAIRSAQN
ncbi:MAG: hypothetical protein F4X56_01015 [Gammaproteobacteria bacterium]|nr:hypothetical protein [Gammaproteobacteria bacterium]